MDKAKISCRRIALLGGLLLCSVASLWAQESINKAQFLEKVWDYEKNTQKVVLKSDMPVILDFWASWCGPCRMLNPELTALQKAYKGKLKVYKINVDEEHDLSRLFGIKAMPTLYFINKEKISYIQGYRTKEELQQIVDSFLLK